MCTCAFIQYSESNNCTLPTVRQNVNIRSIIDDESGTYQVILSCNTSDNGTSISVFLTANCTNNGIWTPDPNSFTCPGSGTESDGNSVRPSDNTGIVIFKLIPSMHISMYIHPHQLYSIQYISCHRISDFSSSCDYHLLHRYCCHSFDNKM